MAKTLKMNITFPMTIVVKTETLETLEEARKDLRELTPEKVVLLKGESKFRYELFTGDKPTEEVLEVIYRMGLRTGIREVIMDEIQGNESNCRVGDIKVSFEKPQAPRSCNGCIKDTCGRPEKLTGSGCPLKMTGVRSAHFEQRFETTQ